MEKVFISITRMPVVPVPVAKALPFKETISGLIESRTHMRDFLFVLFPAGFLNWSNNLLTPKSFV